MSSPLATLQFLGATKTVTGSKYLLDLDGFKVLIDCGLYQGLKELRLRNWEPFPHDPQSIQAVVFTHAHVDHCGFFPRLVKEGFEGPAYCTPSTRNLCRLLLPDTGHLQEEDARLANQRKYSKHEPALPLFTEEDAEQALPLLKTVPFHTEVELRPDLRFQFLHAGHILGSSSVHFTIGRGDRQRRVLFSGDVGRYNRPILEDPESVEETDTLLVESTYGNRQHDPAEPKEALGEVIREGLARGGKVIIPSFAVGRTQELLYLLHELEQEGKIPAVPVYIDSPMAIDATTIYSNHREEHDQEMQREARKSNPLKTSNTQFVRQFQQSQTICRDPRPAVILSASGMLAGGRVLNHLEECLPQAHNTILFVGFQAIGTRGRQLQEGASEIKIHGRYIPARAAIRTIESLSAHADCEELIRWLSPMRKAPRQTFVVHGEEAASRGLQSRLKEKLGWDSEIPDYLDTVELS